MKLAEERTSRIMRWSPVHSLPQQLLSSADERVPRVLTPLSRSPAVPQLVLGQPQPQRLFQCTVPLESMDGWGGKKEYCTVFHVCIL